MFRLSQLHFFLKLLTKLLIVCPYSIRTTPHHLLVSVSKHVSRLQESGSFQRFGCIVDVLNEPCCQLHALIVSAIYTGVTHVFDFYYLFSNPKTIVSVLLRPIAYSATTESDQSKRNYFTLSRTVILFASNNRCSISSYYCSCLITNVSNSSVITVEAYNSSMYPHCLGKSGDLVLRIFVMHYSGTLVAILIYPLIASTDILHSFVRRVRQLRWTLLKTLTEILLTNGQSTAM